MTDNNDPYSQSTFTGYSLWLVPTRQEEVNILKDGMQHIRQQVHADISAPFEPHVTLLSGLNEEDGWTADKIWHAFKGAGQRWASNTKGVLSLKLEEVTTRGLYFQCILIALEKTSELLSINAYMRDAFNAHDQPPYFPHCSLLYGHLTKEQMQQTIQSLKQGDRPLYHETGKGIAFGISDSGKNPIKQIELGAVELWNTNGSVADWKRVHRINLSDLR
ncbi:2, 3 cyclic phosphodiesterase [Meira miltonrushii]|uniref:2, 3 cyclic phosphodiesterase n=1 Tax=Meira miltonrushii TaxID=1280837 RepID=A0A316VG84_9BASI|nr:2, 3 cyclic phosphodiesterase [Meira miltonrushii]PWN34495.1 2, 3 cyclic phosphodiesterase [Meira miltonrushii]